jgi:hypothetical protein
MILDDPVMQQQPSEERASPSFADNLRVSLTDVAAMVGTRSFLSDLCSFRSSVACSTH